MQDIFHRRLRSAFRNTTLPGDKIYSHFRSSPRVYLFYLIFTILSTILVFSAFRAHIINYDLSRFFMFADHDRIVEFVFAFSLACVSSIVGALIFSYIESFRERSSVEHLQHFAPAEFYRDFLNNLSHYDGIIRYDHHVRVQLRNHPKRDDVILCDLNYRYKASRLPRRISMKIFRMTEPADTEIVPLIADECLENEFVGHNAEYDFDQPITIDDYSVSALEVGNKPLVVRRAEATKKLIRYECVLDKPCYDETYIKYRITIPLEVETILTITSEFVTKNSELEFDYSNLSVDINPCIMCFAGIKENILFDDDGHRKIQYRRIEGWLLPRNGWVMSWWRNEKS